MMTLGNLHEIIRNLTAYIKSLDVLCENGLRLSKNFEKLLTPVAAEGCATSPSGPGPINHDLEMVTQSVTTWELAHKVATADTNALISELLPLLQETVQNTMKDPRSFHSPNTSEVFRSCFSAFFQIQWRFCQLYISCLSSNGVPGLTSSGWYPRSPDSHLAKSPTMGSFSSSSLSVDRRESTESCFSGFSLPRSSFSGASMSSRSSSPSAQIQHVYHHYYGQRSRNSSPSIKFPSSQPASPMVSYGEGMRPLHLFRRWSTQTQASGGSSSSGGASGHSHSAGLETHSSGGSCLSGSGGHSLESNPFRIGGYNRRWSVPASSSNQSTQDSTKRSENEILDDGLLTAINLLSSKSNTPSSTMLRDTALEEATDEYLEEEQTRSLWPPSETVPGVVLTTCGSEGDPGLLRCDDFQHSSQHQSLQVPLPGGIPMTVDSSNLASHSHSMGCSGLPVMSGGTGSMRGEKRYSPPHHTIPEYSLFGGSTSTTSSQGHNMPSSLSHHGSPTN